MSDAEAEAICVRCGMRHGPPLYSCPRCREPDLHKGIESLACGHPQTRLVYSCPECHSAALAAAESRGFARGIEAGGRFIDGMQFVLREEEVVIVGRRHFSEWAGALRALAAGAGGGKTT